MNYRSTTIKSKWEKSSWLLKQSNLKKYVPRTMLFNKKNLISMLSTYSTVYFKPTGDSGGFNIIRPFDIRVMVQKTNKGVWVSTAMFAKIGKTGKVATNYNQGGKIGYIHQTMSGAGYNTFEIKRMETRLKELGISVGNNFDQYKKGFRELGLDVALDSLGKPWILEVNTRPQFYPLKNMKDKRLYKRIVSYAKQYGRLK